MVKTFSAIIRCLLKTLMESFEWEIGMENFVTDFLSKFYSAKIIDIFRFH
jgi:hypothetical protein